MFRTSIAQARHPVTSKKIDTSLVEGLAFPPIGVTTEADEHA